MNPLTWPLIVRLLIAAVLVLLAIGAAARRAPTQCELCGALIEPDLVDEHKRRHAERKETDR